MFISLSIVFIIHTYLARILFMRRGFVHVRPFSGWFVFMKESRTLFTQSFAHLDFFFCRMHVSSFISMLCVNSMHCVTHKTPDDCTGELKMELFLFKGQLYMQRMLFHGWVYQDIHGYSLFSTSPAWAGYCFMEKKWCGLSLSIDYWGVTIKFCYSLVPTLLKQQCEANVFTTLHLNRINNLIHICKDD